MIGMVAAGVHMVRDRVRSEALQIRELIREVADLMRHLYLCNWDQGGWDRSSCEIEDAV